VAVGSLSQYRCAICGSLPGGIPAFDCAECGRSLSVCGTDSCGWFVRLFDSDDEADCLNCGYVPVDEHSPEMNVVRDRLRASMERTMEVQRQMRARSGPLYELAKDRSRITSAAWRAAGSPRRVHRVHFPEGARWILGAPKHPKTWRPSTRSDVDAWFGWWHERARLHSTLGWNQREHRGLTGTQDHLQSYD
jgi:hypothetical protein